MKELTIQLSESEYDLLLKIKKQTKEINEHYNVNHSDSTDAVIALALIDYSESMQRRYEMLMGHEGRWGINE